MPIYEYEDVPVAPKRSVWQWIALSAGGMILFAVAILSAGESAWRAIDQQLGTAFTPSLAAWREMLQWLLR